MPSFIPLEFIDFRCKYSYCCSEITYSIRQTNTLSDPPTLDIEENKHPEFYDPADQTNILKQPFLNYVAPYHYDISKSDTDFEAILSVKSNRNYIKIPNDKLQTLTFYIYA